MKVINVYPERKEIHGIVRDGGTVAVSVFEIPSTFRWPQENEIWSIERDRLGNSQWILGSRIHHTLIEDELAVTELNPGDMRLDAENIFNSQGDQIATLSDVISAADANYIHTQGVAVTTWVINHPLNKRPSVSIVDSADTIIEADVQYINNSTVEINFSGATSGKAYLN